jgi:hypothetical protein
VKDFITRGAASEEGFLDRFTANRTFHVGGGIIVEGIEIHLALVFGKVFHFKCVYRFIGLSVYRFIGLGFVIALF